VFAILNRIRTSQCDSLTLIIYAGLAYSDMTLLQLKKKKEIGLGNFCALQ